MQMYANWVWVNKNYKVCFQTCAKGLPPRAILSMPGTWVAFKSQDTPPIETIDIVGKEALINGKGYKIVKRFVV